MTRFADKLAFGRVAEGQIATWLRQRRDYHVLPVYEIEIPTGKGPRFLTPSAELVAPDILAMRGDDVRWIEAKHKDVWSWYRIGGYWTTGIDLHHYLQYIEVSKTVKYPIWLLFLHRSATPDMRDIPYCGGRLCPTGLFAGRIDRLVTRESHRSDRWGASGMVYWAHSAFQQLATLEEIETAGGDRCSSP